MTDYSYTTIAALAPRLRSGELSPVALVESQLERIERMGALRAFVTVTANVARAQAERAAREIAQGWYRGPLHGIPLSLKDLIDTRAIRTTCGSRLLADHVPARDATVTARLEEAGAVLVGKAALHEFAYGVTTSNRYFGPTRNPWALDRIPGGSSGGSGAAVAAGLGCASIGTDTGGSIRIPAALCGIVGLKPSYGRVSRCGVFPLSGTADHVGPLTRSVEDAAILLQAMAGPDPGDPATLGRSCPDFRSAVRREVRGLRIGVLDDTNFEVGPSMRGAFAVALSVLRKLGMHLEQVTLQGIDAAFAAQTAIVRAEAADTHERWLAERSDDYEPETLAQLREGQSVTATEYLRARRTRDQMIEQYTSLLARVDALVLPSTPVAAPRIGQSWVDLNGNAVEVRSLLTKLTRFFNLVGAPALSVPCGFDEDGLPLGLQIAGGVEDEQTIIAVGAAFERATSWHLERPPVQPG